MKTSATLPRIVLLELCAAPLHGAESFKEQVEWGETFAKAKVEGTLAILDLRDDGEKRLAFNADRANQRFTPASTFKIPHALFALDADAVSDEFEVIFWDGKKRDYEPWNADQNLRSSMRHSVVWVYERFAEKIGVEQETAYLEKVGYGNQKATGTAPFWIDGDLEISAIEQVMFLVELYFNRLPFRETHQRLVKDIMLVEAGKDWRLRGKTGWSGTVGWFVGWVESPTGPLFFALNIDTPRRMNDLPAREGVTREVLVSLGALPKNADE